MSPSSAEAWPLIFFKLFALWGLGLAGIIATLEPADGEAPEAAAQGAESLSRLRASAP